MLLPLRLNVDDWSDVPVVLLPTNIIAATQTVTDVARRVSYTETERSITVTHAQRSVTFDG